MKEPTRVDADETLNALVVRYPAVLPVLSAHGLDACCGGAPSVRGATRRHGLDLGQLVEAVPAAVATGS